MAKEVNIGGRPTKFTPQTIALLEEAFSMGCTDLEACCHADVSKTAFYNYQEKTEGFVDRKELLKEKVILAARQSVFRGFAEDSNLALKFLERKKRDEFSLKTEQDVKVELPTPIMPV